MYAPPLCNPPEFEASDDLASLHYLNEPSGTSVAMHCNVEMNVKRLFSTPRNPHAIFSETHIYVLRVGFNRRKLISARRNLRP